MTQQSPAFLRGLCKLLARQWETSLLQHHIAGTVSPSEAFVSHVLEEVTIKKKEEGIGRSMEANKHQSLCTKSKPRPDFWSI